MEHAPLRPVPTRPPGSVDPLDAARHVASSLPGLDAPGATAFSLVALVGRSRTETAETTGLDPEALGAALARARKALRRSMFPLPGSGWCERSERLVSDRLDDALESPGPARLEVHLRNCPRCVEHERRLVQATDAMVAAFAPTPAPTPAPAPAPALSIVERTASPAPAVRPFGEPVRPAPARVRPPRPAVAPEPDALPVPLAPPVPAPLLRSPNPASAIAWTALLVLAVILAVATVAIAVAGALGASL